MIVADFRLTRIHQLGYLKHFNFQSANLAPLYVFFVYCCLITLFMPFVFDGIEVVSPGQDNGTYAKLHFSLKHILQIIYIALHVIVIIILKTISNRFLFLKIFKLINSLILFVSIIGFWEFFAKVSETYAFPSDFLYNNPSYAQYWLQGIRLNSTFTEPSYAGAFLGASVAYLLYSRINVKLLVIAAIALILNLSGTGLVSFSLFCFFSLLIEKQNRGKYIFIIMMFILIITVFISLIGYKDLMYDMLIYKADSQSGTERSSIILFTINLLEETYFLGLGLGSHRCFSFLTGMMANIGIVGLLLFFWYIFIILRPICKSRNRYAKGLLAFDISLFFALCIAIPDFTFPVLWMSIFLTTIISSKLTSSSEYKRKLFVLYKISANSESWFMRKIYKLF